MERVLKVEHLKVCINYDYDDFVDRSLSVKDINRLYGLCHYKK